MRNDHVDALPEELRELGQLAHQMDDEDLLDGEPITPENIMKKFQDGELELPPEMAECLDELKKAQEASANPMQYLPDHPDYNPYAGKPIGFVIKQFLAFTPNIGIRRFADAVKIQANVEHPVHGMVEIEGTIDRKRLQDIIDEKVTPETEEYEALAITLQKFVVRDAQFRERKKESTSDEMRKKELIARATRKKTGMNRAEFRRMRAINKTKK